MNERGRGQCTECAKLLTADESSGLYRITCAHGVGLPLHSVSRHRLQQQLKTSSLAFGDSFDRSMDLVDSASNSMASGSSCTLPVCELNDTPKQALDSSMTSTSEISCIVHHADDSVDNGECRGTDALAGCTARLQQQVNLLNNDGDIIVRRNYIDGNEEDDIAQQLLDNDDDNEGSDDGDEDEGAVCKDHTRTTDMAYDNGDYTRDDYLMAENYDTWAGDGLLYDSNGSHLLLGAHDLGSTCHGHRDPRLAHLDEEDGAVGKRRGFGGRPVYDPSAGYSSFAGYDDDDPVSFILPETGETSTTVKRRGGNHVKELLADELDNNLRIDKKRCDCCSVLSHLSCQPHLPQSAMRVAEVGWVQPKPKASSTFIIRLLLLLLVLAVVLVVVCHQWPSWCHQLRPFGLFFRWDLRHVGGVPPV
jgi:hypothetical protein